MIHGQCFKQGASAQYAATVALMHGGLITLQVHDVEPAVCISCPIQAATVAPALGSIPRTLTFEGGWIFTAHEQTELNLFLDEHLKIGLAHRFERNSRWIFGGIIGTIAFVVGLYVFGVPALTNAITRSLPEVAFESAGKQSLSTLDTMLFKPSHVSAERQAALSARFERLLGQQSTTRHKKPVLLFRDMQGIPNAMALADGSVVITDDLIKLLQSDDQIDAVLYHELGHVHGDHVMKAAVKSSLVSLALAVMVGDSSNMADVFTGGASLVLMMDYSRDMEREADEFAAVQLQRTTGTVAPFVTAFRLLESSTTKPNTTSRKDNTPQWLNSHPDTESRIEHILAVGEKTRTQGQ